MDDILGDIGASVASSAEVSTTATQNENSAPLGAQEETVISTESASEAESSLTTKQSETSEEISEDEVSEEAVREMIANPMTPRALREKLQKGLQYAKQFKTERNEFEAKYNQLQEKYSPFEGKEAVSPQDIERLRQSEQLLSEIQSFSATPETVEKFLKETNPQVFEEFQNQAVQTALYKEDGSPDLDNWQFIIDRNLGYDANNPNETKVYAQDLMKIAEAIKNGDLSVEDLALDSVEDFAHRNKMRSEAEQLKSRLEYQETQIRGHEIGQIKESIRGEIIPQIHASLEKFNLMPAGNEPKIAAEFKSEVTRKLDSFFGQALKEIRGLSEIQKAIDLVGKASGKEPEAAVAEVRGLLNHPSYQRNLHSGVSELMSRVDKLLGQEAYRYKLMMMGYEAENSKGQNAREVINNANQNKRVTEYSQEDLDRMEAAQRNRIVREQAGSMLMDIKNPAPRLG